MMCSDIETATAIVILAIGIAAAGAVLFGAMVYVIVKADKADD